MLFDVKDNGKPLTVAYSGGTAFNFVNDVPHFDTYIGSQRKMAARAAAAGATVLMSNHSEFDNAVNKIRMLAGRKARRAASVRDRSGSGGALFQGHGRMRAGGAAQAAVSRGSCGGGPERGLRGFAQVPSSRFGARADCGAGAGSSRFRPPPPTTRLTSREKPHDTLPCIRFRRSPGAVRRSGPRAAEGQGAERAGDSLHLGAELPEAAAGRVSGRSRSAWRPTPRATSSSIHRSANTRLFEFDQNGNFLKEIGKGYYGFEFAHSVRVDPQDNIWTVDEGTNMVTKFSPEGKVLMVLGRRPPAGRRRRRDAAPARTSRRRSTSSAARPTSAGIRRATSSSPTATATTAS